jgi:ribonuclease HI
MNINNDQENNSTIEIHADGSCLKNPGMGGWGAILLYKQHKKEISGQIENTTNNQMELKAVIEGLKQIKKPAKIIIYTDSQYVKNGITSWIFNWKKNGWRTADKKPVKNLELWQELENLTLLHKIEWRWVKGHNGDKYNEMVDKLARNAALGL